MCVAFFYYAVDLEWHHNTLGREILLKVRQLAIVLFLNTHYKHLPLTTKCIVDVVSARLETIFLDHQAIIIVIIVINDGHRHRIAIHI
jgi:hypothetical protein